MIVGSFILALNPEEYFFLGISFTIIGSGFFKPNISTMVGALYKQGDTRTDAGFSLFYAGINLGALLGGYACIAIAQDYSWKLAFGLAAIVMTISLVTFIFTQRSLGPIGLPPVKTDGNTNKNWYEYAVYGGSLLVIPIIMIMVSKTQYTDWFMYIIGPCVLIYLVYEMIKYPAAERKKLLAALIFILFSILFWAFFEQSGGSLSLFAANNLKDTVLGVHLNPNGVNNSANSLFVIAFAAVVGMTWIWMNKRKIEPNTIVKFGLGFLFLAGGFYVFYWTKFFADSNGMTSLNLFIFGWFVITFGELCLSPIGMSVMTKLSPPKLQAMMMGMWFLASAYGQYFAGLLGANIAEASNNSTNLESLMIYAEGYKQLAVYALIAGVIMIAISPMVKKLMGEVK
jgi:POT family proton-dependent oligopeptide transporter